MNSRTNNKLVQAFNVNKLNELTNLIRSGTLTVAGLTTSAATNVTVNTSNAVRYADWTFAATNFTLVNGTNIFTAIARDSLGDIDTNVVSANLPATNNYLYDLNGNLRTNGNQVLDYDDENELIRVTVTNSWKDEFTYDGKFRRRIEKDYTWSGGAWVQTNQTHFIYDGNVVIEERNSNNVPLVTYTRGNDLSGTMQGAGGIGGLLARSDHSLPPTPYYSVHSYYHADGNGNVTMLINSSQAVVAKYLYDPFGNTLAMSGTMANANTYRFSSKEWNNNANYYYYGRRYYDPNLQRWLNRDPIQEEGGINLYAFVDNDSLSTHDALGLDTMVTSGPGTVTGGFWTIIKHHLPFHKKGPPVTDTFTITCPSSEPYLVSYGLSGAYSPPYDNFPTGWSSIQTGSSPNYIITINVPSRITLFGLQDELSALYVQGSCSCKCINNPIPRNDPPAPPPRTPSSPPYYPYPGAGPI